MEQVQAALLAKERQLVVPGEVLARGLEWLPSAGCYRANNEVRAKQLGLVRIKERFIGVTPLAGVYVPRPGDGIIGIVTDIQTTFWVLDINSPYDSILQLGEAVGEYVDTTKTDISVYYDIGDVVYAKVLAVSRSKSVQLTMNDYRAKKLIGGRLMRITPSKVPRLIGKAGSMVELIKNKTGCQIVIGQNGVVWLKGDKEAVAAKAVAQVEAEAHIEGLTERITKMLEAGG